MKRKRIYGAAGIPALLVACLLSAAALAPAAHAQNAPLDNTTAAEPGPEHALIRQMVGTWDVQARIWTGPDAEPTMLPPAVAHRRLIDNTFFEEVMKPAPGSDQEPFTRLAYLNYNDVSKRYEWISMDTRAPQMMYETSYGGSAPGRGQAQRAVTLYLDSFVLPQWGEATNVAFKQRRVIEVEKDRQVVSQYWTPLSGQDADEFLAVEYVYTRQR